MKLIPVVTLGVLAITAWRVAVELESAAQWLDEAGRRLDRLAERIDNQ